MGPGEARKFSDLGNRIFRLLEDCTAVIVAGIDGFCLGGGFDLALAADWRIATDRSVFGHPGADLGLVTGFGGTQRLPRLIGRNRAAGYLFTGERIRAAKAYRDGVLQEICPDESFEEFLMARVEHFRDMPLKWIAGAKQNFRYGYEGWAGT
jgi:enoyl-CoA hydratase